jgi:hypothetical protein
MQRFVAGDQQASDVEVKERQVKAAIKNVVRRDRARREAPGSYLLGKISDEAGIYHFSVPIKCQ